MSGRMIDVPMGSPPRPCRFCAATIYFAPTAAGKKLPVHCDVPDGRRPTDTGSGLGIPHFADCPGAAEARRKTPRRPTDEPPPQEGT